MRHALSTLSAAKRAIRLSFGRDHARAVLMPASLLAMIALLGTSASHAQPNVDRFTATTTSMTPSDVELRIDVLEWSDPASRAAVVAALDEPDATRALSELPTLGYVWRSHSAVGSAVKYAHRVVTAEGDRITFVTARRIDATEFRPWTANPESRTAEHDYTVIELYLDDDGGVGTLSLAAEIQLDRQNALVSLADGAPRLLAGAKEEPKPHWARES
jgi:hypothetical protein